MMLMFSLKCLYIDLMNHSRELTKTMIGRLLKQCYMLNHMTLEIQLIKLVFC